MRLVAWIGYNGFIGMGLAYFLWFVVADRLSTTTASLGSLLVPVVGVIGSAIVIGEQQSLFDMIGFACISRPPRACCCSRTCGTTRCRSSYRKAHRIDVDLEPHIAFRLGRLPSHSRK